MKKVISEIDEWGDGKVYEYTDDGLLLGCTEYENGKITKLTTYDSDGNILLEDIIDEYDIKMTTSYEYDENGMLLGKYIYDDEGNLFAKYKYEYEYDDKGEVIQTKELEYDGENRLRDDWVYDRDGKLMSKRSYDGAGLVYSELVYGPDGKIIDSYEHTSEEIAEGVSPTQTEIEAVMAEAIDGQVKDKNIEEQ